jgi:hypothetical protein
MVESSPTCYAFVVVRNTDDFHRVRQWCMDNMKGDPMIRVPHKFPIGISAYDERAGWTDSMDRAAKYVEVDYFFEHNRFNTEILRTIDVSREVTNLGPHLLSSVLMPADQGAFRPIRWVRPRTAQVGRPSVARELPRMRRRESI